MPGTSLNIAIDGDEGALIQAEADLDLAVSRVLQIVDVYDALTTERPYKPAYSMDKALAIMREEVQKNWWDPRIFDAFSDLVRRVGFHAPADEEREPVADQTSTGAVSTA